MLLGSHLHAPRMLDDDQLQAGCPPYAMDASASLFDQSQRTVYSFVAAESTNEERERGRKLSAEEEERRAEEKIGCL
jgi:hypothetical protein